MVIDSSALIAILLEEPDAGALAEVIEDAAARLLSAATFVEAAIVIEARKGSEGARDLELLISRTGIQVVAVDAAQAREAQLAWRRFGKGNHPAGLNLGDVFSYALAKVTGSQLLYKGDDFAQTDLEAALPPP
jgi:ribonuclease VapC